MEADESMDVRPCPQLERAPALAGQLSFATRCVSAPLAAEGTPLRATLAAARCRFSVLGKTNGLKGDTELSGVARCSEGVAQLGAALRSGEYVLSMASSGLAFVSGTAEARARGAFFQQHPPGLCFSVARALSEDAVLSVSVDAKQRRSELCALWGGETFLQRGSVSVAADPVARTVRLGASYSTPGPEWRVSVVNEDDTVVDPPDDGARHTFFVTNTISGRRLMAKTQAGCSLDLGRLLHNLAEKVEDTWVWRLPIVLWQLPLSVSFYRLLIPGKDQDQYRYPLRHWDLGVVHDFDRTRPQVSLTRRLGKSGRGGGIGISYDLDNTTLSARASSRGVSVVATLNRRSPDAGGGWINPGLHFAVEPLLLG